MSRSSEPSYRVVVNDEHEHTIWPADRCGPPGWDEIGVAGSKAECLAYIAAVWSNLVPAPAREPSS